MGAAWRWLRRAFHDPSFGPYRFVHSVVWLLIAFSVALLIVDLSLTLRPEARRILERVDVLVLWLFAVEIIARVITYESPRLTFFRNSPWRRLWIHFMGRLRYCLRPMTLIDILTVAALVPALRGLRALRLLRLLRSKRIFRYSSPFRGIERAFRDHGLLFGFAFSLLLGSVILGGLSLFLVERGRNPEVLSIADGLWWSLVTLTTVGFGDITPVTPVGRTIGSVLMVAGMFNLALFAGIVGRTLVDTVISLREEQFRMSSYLDHVVVCGYDSGAAMLLDALRHELDIDNETVVFFARGERPPEVGPEFVWVSGDPTKESELDKARVAFARVVIVVGSRNTTPQHADANSILTAFTIRSALRRHPEVKRRDKPLYMVVEILDAENVAHARTAGADEVIETTRLGFSLMAHAVPMPGTGTIASRVVSTGHNSIFTAPIPPKLRDCATYGDLSHELKERHGVLLLGLRDPVATEDRVNPPDEAPVPAGCQLIYLAQSPVLSPPRKR